MAAAGWATPGSLVAIKDNTDLTLQTASKIGHVSVDMKGTACKVPSAPDYIKKVQQRGAVGKKRKTARC